MKDKISIIIPVYKVEKYIRKCLDSVINQTYKNLDIILIDDGSPDMCGQICDEYAKKDKRIRVIHKKNGGISDTRNVGIKEANGRYIFFLDSDDYIASDSIEYLHELLKKNKCDISIGKYKEIFDQQEENKKVLDCKTNDVILSKEEALEEIFYNRLYTNSIWNKLFKKELFKNISFPVGKRYEDLSTTYKVIANANKIVYSNKITYYYLCDREESIMNEKYSSERLDGLYFCLEILDYIKNNYPSIVKSAINRLYIECIHIYSIIPSSKEYDKDRKIIRKYLKKYRFDILFRIKTKINLKIFALLTIFNSNYIIKILFKYKKK